MVLTAATKGPQRGSSAERSQAETGTSHRFLPLSVSPPDLGLLRKITLERGWAFLQGHLDDLSQVEDMAIRALGDLLPATEPIGDDQPVRRGLSNRREQLEFSYGDG